MAGFYFIFLQIFLSVGMIRIAFMDVFESSFHYNGINPDGNQITETVTNASNMIDRLSSSGYGFLPVLLIILLGISALTAFLSLFLGEVKVITVGSKIVWVVSMILFVVCFIMAAKTGGRY